MVTWNLNKVAINTYSNHTSSSWIFRNSNFILRDSNHNLTCSVGVNTRMCPYVIKYAQNDFSVNLVVSVVTISCTCFVSTQHGSFVDIRV